jgi:hypothetical protein
MHLKQYTVTKILHPFKARIPKLNQSRLIAHVQGPGAPAEPGSIPLLVRGGSPIGLSVPSSALGGIVVDAETSDIWARFCVRCALPRCFSSLWFYLHGFFFLQVSTVMHMNLVLFRGGTLIHHAFSQSLDAAHQLR